MDNVGQATTTPNPPGKWLTFVSAHPRRAANIFFFLCLLFAAIPIAVGAKFGRDYLTVSIWGGALALFMLGAGLWLSTRDPTAPLPLDAARLFNLIVGGLTGFLTWYFSLTLLWKWWNTITGGFDAWQGRDWWHLWVFLLAQLGGLFVLFVSLLVARAEERSQPILRRLLYGYNAALSGLLLFEVLLVLNVLVAVNAPAAQDWTKSKYYSISQQSINILKALKQPLKVYVLVPQGDPVYDEVTTLMDSCRNITDKLQVIYVPPDRRITAFAELRKEFPLVERGDLLLVMDGEKEKKSQIVKRKDLESAAAGGFRPRGEEKLLFKGEDAFLSAVKVMTDTAAKVVYFLQGNGELDLSDTSTVPEEQRGGTLKKRLTADGYTIKRLRLSTIAGGKGNDPDLVVDKKVPADATIVVAAGPNQALPEDALKALDDYMNARKGKMLVLLDVNAGANGKMVETGLEKFVEKFNVKVDADRLLRVPESQALSRNPEVIYVVANPRNTSPLATAFLTPRLVPFTFDRARSVRTEGAAGASPLNAEVLLLPFFQHYVFSETNLTTSAEALVERIIKDPKLQDEKLGRPQSVGVAITERSQPMQPPSFHGGPEQEGTPRLVVIGNAKFAANPLMREDRNNPAYSLVAGILAWLRERPESIGLEPKKVENYKLKPETELNQLILAPALLMFVGIVGLGVAVWTARRR